MVLIFFYDYKMQGKEERFVVQINQTLFPKISVLHEHHENTSSKNKVWELCSYFEN